MSSDEQDKKPLLTRARLIGAALALGGMILGSLVGIGVQAGVESTGLLGPSVEALIAEQESNFDEMGERIEALRGMASDPEMAKTLAELGKLVARQDDLQRKASQQIAFLDGQVQSLREESLAENRFAGGADFWLGSGESVSVGDSRNVLGVVRTLSNAVDVNLNSQKSRLSVGDTIDVPAEGGDCIVLVKQTRRSEDGRVGFDLSCS